MSEATSAKGGQPPSYLLDSAMAKLAVGMVQPMIDGMMASGQTNRRHLHVVVMNPALPFRGDVMEFERAILYEQTWGEPKEWERNYFGIARGKALIAWRDRLNARTVQNDEPWLLRLGDTRYVGSVALGRNGSLVISASGVQNYFDEYFCHCIGGAIRALCRHAIANLPPQIEVLE